MRAFFLCRLLVLHKKWFCECEVETPSSIRPGWGCKVPELLCDSATPLHWHRKLEADVVFWEVCFIGIFVLFSQAPSAEHIRLDGVGGCIWKPLKSPCPILVFDSENLAGAWLCGQFSFYLSVSLNSLQKRRLFWLYGRIAFGKKDNQRKMGGLGFHLQTLSQWGKKPSTEHTVFLNQYKLGISIS